MFTPRPQPPTHAVDALPVLIAALPTPFDQAGDVHVATYLDLLAHVEPWVDGVLVSGTTAEFLALTDAERARLAELALSVIGAERTIVHVGAASLRQATRIAASARKAGAYRFAALTPFYFDHTAEDVNQFFSDLREHLDAEELYGYFFTERTGISLTPKEMGEIVTAAMLDGIKISGDIWRDLPAVRNEVGDHLPIYTGYDHDPLRTQQLGATGVVSGLCCIAPHLFRQLALPKSTDPTSAQAIATLGESAGGSLRELKAGLAAAVPGEWSLRIPDARRTLRNATGVAGQGTRRL